MQNLTSTPTARGCTSGCQPFIRRSPALTLLLCALPLLLALPALAQTQPVTRIQVPEPPKPVSVPLRYEMGTNSLGQVTNGPAVFNAFAIWRTNISLVYPGLLQHLPTNLTPAQLQQAQSLSTQTVARAYGYTNQVFDHLLPHSLNYLVWTNYIAHTNNRTVLIWSERRLPQGWPAIPPLVEWDPQCLMWGMKGETALSPCWQNEGNLGQVPITLLTRRHGYTRGHSMGPDGFHHYLAGQKVWFLTRDNRLVEATIAREVVRTVAQSRRDYTIVLFSKDLPPDIESMRVVAADDFLPRYRLVMGAPWVLFQTEQSGRVSSNVPGFTVPTWKGGDSGSPNMLPLPGELVFVGGRSTSGASPEMQADMDELCRQQHLDPARYRLSWVDLSSFPKF